jgi:predicted membrane-bound spermidine synthase
MRWVLTAAALLAVMLLLTREVVLATLLAAAATVLVWLTRRAVRDPWALTGVVALPAGLLLIFAGLAECDRADCGPAGVLYWLSPLGLVLVALSIGAGAVALARRRR